MSPKNAVTLGDAANLTKHDIFDLDDAYRSHLLTTKRDGGRQGVFHPSALGMCARMNVYEFIGAKKIQTIEPEALEIFDMGHSVHELVQGRFDAMGAWAGANSFGYQFRKEVPYDPKTDHLYNTFGCGGTTDGILEIWTDSWKQRGIIEIKSINDDGFKKLTQPKLEHLEQAHLYCFRFDCPIMWIWYFNKNTSRRQVFPVVFDQDIFQGAIAKLDLWHQHAMNGTLPEREESFFGCQGCGYRDECKPESLSKIRVSKTNTAKLSMR